MFDLQALLGLAVDKGASDIHLAVGQPPVLRKSGSLILGWEEPVTAEDMTGILDEVMPPQVKERFQAVHEADFPLHCVNIGRFRMNAFISQGSPVLAIRAIQTVIPTFSELRLPDILPRIALEPSGIFMVSGPTSSGKSTSMARMIQHINENESRRIITLEDPIEFVYLNKLSMISQREVGVDTLSYEGALRQVVRQDPDVVVIGEVRDADSMMAAMAMAETGHLVLSTVHADSTSQTIQRVVGLFPSHEREAARMNLAANLVGVMCQRLFPGASGGLVPAVEILLNTPIVRKIIQENTLEKLRTAVSTDAESGMQSLSQSLLKLIDAGEVTEEDALAYAPNPDALVMALDGIDLQSDRRIMSE